MNGEMIGVIGGMAILAIWYFLVWPIIKRGMKTASTAVGGVLEDAFRPKADSAETLLLATRKSRLTFNRHIGVFADDLERVEEGVRATTEGQLMIVAFSVTLLNLSIQDVAYDQGNVDRLKLLSDKNGFPSVNVSDNSLRAALQDIWSNFSPITRTNLDMRYRYIFGANLNSDYESKIYHIMSNYCMRSLKREFTYGSSADLEWFEFLISIADGDQVKAKKFLDNWSRDENL